MKLLRTRTPEQKIRRRETWRRHYAKNKAELYRKAREWAIKNPEKIKACQYKSRLKHRDKNLERCRRYYRDNREGQIARSAAFASTQQGKYTQYGSGARKRKIDFLITPEQFITFWQKPCHYCGSDIETIGIDRVDNARAYVLCNLVPCCTLCNWLKRHMPASKFLDHCFRIVEHNSQKAA